jgi:uncharacterized protein (DUF1697 family)
MPKYIAFLRAINVGGHTVKMDALRSLFESQGFLNVETFIASGNVIFDAASRNADSLERKIETCLYESLGYPVSTFVRSSSELSAIARHQAFPKAQMNLPYHALYIGFLGKEPSKEAKQKLLASATGTDLFQIHDRELYWLCRTKFSDSQFSGARLEKMLGMPATLRNVTTIQKLASKYA